MGRTAYLVPGRVAVRFHDQSDSQRRKIIMARAARRTSGGDQLAADARACSAVQASTANPIPARISATPTTMPKVPSWSAR